MTAKTTISLGILILAGVVLFIVLFMLSCNERQEQLGEKSADEIRSNEEAPEHVYLLIAEPEERPQPTQLAMLQETDRSTLLRLYEATSDLSRRRALVWALAHLGGERVADLFIQALTTEFKDKALSQREEDTLCDTIRALGCVAKDDDAAYEFLKRASDTPFWKEQRLWKSPRGAYCDDLLVSYSVQAVAISGRSDAMSFLESLKAQQRRYLHAFAGDIAQGAFYLHLRQRGGQRLLMEYMLTPGNKTLFEQWIKTDQGARWLEWANDQMRGPRP